MGRALDGLAENPRPGPPAGKPLKGYPGLWRLRIAGSYRVVYRLDERAGIVRVRLIGHRRDVYRDLRPDL